MIGAMLQTYDARNADLRYWVNGQLLHRDQPGLSPFDSVVQGGDAVWEGLRLTNGRIFALEEHAIVQACRETGRGLEGRFLRHVVDAAGQDQPQHRIRGH